MSAVAELCVIVLHSVRTEEENPDAGSYSELMGFLCFKDHSTTTQSVVFSVCTNMATVFFLSDFSCYEAN